MSCYLFVLVVSTVELVIQLIDGATQPFLLIFWRLCVVIQLLQFMKLLLQLSILEILATSISRLTDTATNTFYSWELFVQRLCSIRSANLAYSKRLYMPLQKPISSVTMMLSFKFCHFKASLKLVTACDCSCRQVRVFTDLRNLQLYSGSY